MGFAVASCHGGSIITTSKVATLESFDQSKVVTFAWMGMQCGGTCHSEGSRSSALPTYRREGGVLWGGVGGGEEDMARATRQDTQRCIASADACLKGSYC